MTITTLTELEVAAKKKFLSIAHVSRGNNGYPTPETGVIVHGFDSWETLVETQQEFGGKIYAGKKKQGWTACCLYEPRSEMFHINKYLNLLGENYDIAESVETETHKTRERLREMNDQGVSFNEMSDFLEQKDTLIREIENLEQDQSVITRDGYYYETADNNTLTINHNYQSYFIGLYFPYSTSFLSK